MHAGEQVDFYVEGTLFKFTVSSNLRDRRDLLVSTSETAEASEASSPCGDSLIVSAWHPLVEPARGQYLFHTCPLVSLPLLRLGSLAQGALSFPMPAPCDHASEP